MTVATARLDGTQPGLSPEQFRRLAAYGDREEVRAGAGAVASVHALLARDRV